ncbi:MAG: aminomethyltransferase beta-barrel domain-containing protein, partial [Pseudonocardiales bacterium]
GGSFGYTVGQRRGLNLNRPSPKGEPRYVLSIQPKTNTLVVGPGELLDADEVTAQRPLWTSGTAPADEFDCLVQLRAHGMVTAATVRATAAEVVARLHRSQRGVAPGQALVMYDDDVVVGSATIAAARGVGVNA